MEISEFMARMNAKEVKEVKDIKEANMGNAKEIRIRQISRKDTKAGPMIAMMDGESAWYSTFKSAVTEHTWEIMSGLKEGDYADIKWEESTGKDGKVYKNLTAFEKVLRDSPPTAPAKCLSGETGQTTPPPAPRQDGREDMIAKQVCLKAGTEIVVSMLAVDEKANTDPAGQVIVYAKRLYQGLKEPWD